MSVSAGDTLGDSVRRLLTVPGLVVVVLFLFVRHRIALAGDGVFETVFQRCALVTENALQMVALVVVFRLTYLVVTVIAGIVPLCDLTGAFNRGVETLIVVFGVSLSTSAYLRAVGGVGGQSTSAPAGQSDSLGT